MKKIFYGLALIPMLLIGALVGLNFQQGSSVSYYVQDQGSLEVVFCPQEECEATFLSFLDSAESSIHCALFDVGLESVQKKLLEKARDIEVQVVTDDGYLKKFDHEFVKADRSGLMHNKFCIVDGKRVSTGSMNPTNNGVNKNNNNLLFIESQVLAANYEVEFQELWNGIFKKGDLVETPRVKLGNIGIQNYFCPDDICSEKIKKELQKAEKSIYFMTFSFTHDGIANTILIKNLEDITIRGVMEARQVSKYSKFDVLEYQLGHVSKESSAPRGLKKDSNPQNMHHKTFIIDEKVVITGSMNPTAGGDTRNDENVLIIEDEEIAREFVKEFWKVYGAKI